MKSQYLLAISLIGVFILALGLAGVSPLASTGSNTADTYIETYRGYQVWFHPIGDIGGEYYYVLGYTNHFATVPLAEAFIDTLPHPDYLVEVYWHYSIWFHETTPNFGYWYVQGYTDTFASLANAESFINTLPHPERLIETYKTYSIYFHETSATTGYYYVKGYTTQYSTQAQAEAFIDSLVAPPPPPPPNTYVITTSTITISGTSGGSISPSAANVTAGNSQTFTFAPSSGYEISAVIVDGAPVPISTSYTFSNVQRSHEIIVTFSLSPISTPIVYVIAATSSSGGTILPSGLINVTAGDSQAFHFTPDNSSHISEVSVDGSIIMPVPISYTFSNVQGSHTIVITFASNGYNWFRAPITDGIGISLIAIGLVGYAVMYQKKKH